MGIFSAINSLIQSKKQKKEAAGITPVNTPYTASVDIAKLANEGKNLYSGRMVGAGAAEENLLTQNANFGGGVDRNATSGSQAIAAKAGALGQTDQSFIDLANTEARDKQNRFGIYSNVAQLQANEQDKVYQDKLRTYYDDLNYKRGLEGASKQNMAGFWGGLDDLTMAAVSAFVPGGILAGKGGGGGGSQLSVPSQNYGYNLRPNVTQGASPASQFGQIPYRPMINR